MSLIAALSTLCKVILVMPQICGDDQNETLRGQSGVLADLRIDSIDRDLWHRSRHNWLKRLVARAHRLRATGCFPADLLLQLVSRLTGQPTR